MLQNAFQAPPLTRLLLLLTFNLAPLAFVLAGRWTPFEVMAFYWVEVIAFGIAALVKFAAIIGWRLRQQDTAQAFAAVSAVLLLPVHFGFFMVLTCFLVGSFLPEGTETRKLTSPFVPMEMVLAHIDFVLLLLWALLFRAADFFMRFLPRKEYEGDIQKPILEAYGHLGILFLAGFFGVLLGMATHDGLWGVVLLVGFKTAVDIAVLRLNITRQPAQDAAV